MPAAILTICFAIFSETGGQPAETPQPQPALAAIIADLEGDQPKAHIAAAHALLDRDPNQAERVVAAVIGAIRSGLYRSQKAAVGGIAVGILRKVPDQEGVFQALVPLLESPIDRVVDETTRVLGQLPCPEQLAELLQRGASPRQRTGAAIALSHLVQTETTRQSLVAGLADRDRDVRFACARTLVYVSRIEQVPDEVVPPILEMIEFDSGARLESALWLISQLGNRARAASARLQELTRNAVRGTRIAAAVALVAVNPENARDAVTPLAEGLADSPTGVLPVIVALASLGPVAHDALPALRPWLNSENPRFRAHAAYAAAKIAPDEAGPESIRILLSLFQDHRKRIDMPIVDKLAELGTLSRPAVPTLQKLLGNPETEEAAIALALVRIDPDDAQSAREWIRNKLAFGPHDPAASDIARAISRRGQDYQSLLPEITELLNSSTPWFRQCAATSLGAMGPEARAALPELRSIASSDPDENVQRFAAKAIDQITHR